MISQQCYRISVELPLMWSKIFIIIKMKRFYNIYFWFFSCVVYKKYEKVLIRTDLFVVKA